MKNQNFFHFPNSFQIRLRLWIINMIISYFSKLMDFSQGVAEHYLYPYLYLSLFYICMFIWSIYAAFIHKIFIFIVITIEQLYTLHRFVYNIFFKHSYNCDTCSFHLLLIIYSIFILICLFSICFFVAILLFNLLFFFDLNLIAINYHCGYNGIDCVQWVKGILNNAMPFSCCIACLLVLVYAKLCFFNFCLFHWFRCSYCVSVSLNVFCFFVCRNVSS